MAMSPLIDAHSLIQMLAAPAASARPVCVIDVRFNLAQADAGQEAFHAGHIPGALYAHLDRDLSGPKTGRNGRHPLPSPEAFTATARRWGLQPDTHVVVMDDQGGMFAARLWWMLRWLGHDAVQVLDGGWKAWLAAGGPVSLDTPLPAPGHWSAAPRPGHLRQVDEVWREVSRGDAGAQALCLIDARAPDRFRGENETLDPVGGHIPGARNRFFQLNLQADGRFKPAAELREAFTALLQGQPLDTVVHQCGSGVTACHNLLAMAVAGLPPTALYAGSWSEWCSEPSRPVARG
jgi:thiosulfate/3-mercaptopyruvate sulfurtransferase